MTREARRPVAVIVSRFPLVTETFILRELVELERQGQPVRLVPLLREDAPVVHRDAASFQSRASYTPFLSPAILAANVRGFFRRPLRYLKLLGHVVGRSLSSANLLLGAIGIFPKSVYLAERLQGEGVEHVHAHFATHPTLAAYVIHRWSGIAYSFTVHAHDIFVHRAMLGEKIRAASFVRAISSFNRRFLLERFPWAGEKIHVIHVGVDGETFAPGPESAKRKGEASVLLSVAALKPYKGLPVLIEACAELKREGVPFRCDIVGEGPERPRLERLVRERGLEGTVLLLGAEPEDRVAERMRGADVFVLPSVVADDGQMEGIPVALMEAMALQRPVVASELSGIPELVENEVTGLLVGPGEVEALGRALVRLVDDRALAVRLGERARVRVESQFRLDVSVTRLLERIDAVSLSWPLSLVPEGAKVRAIHVGPDAEVGELDLVTGRAIVKVHRARSGQSAPPAERARREFEALTRYSALSVPRALAIDEPAGALSMEACHGERLDTVLRRARLTPLSRELDDALRDTGRWLREFQAATTTHEPGDGRIRDLAEVAGSERGDRWVDALQVPALCGHHGDFWPGNVFIDRHAGVERSRVQVIDFEGYRLGLPLEDAAWFTLHLDLFFAKPLLRRLRERATSVFLEGYLDGLPLDHQLYTLCRAVKAAVMVP